MSLILYSGSYKALLTGFFEALQEIQALGFRVLQGSFTGFLREFGFPLPWLKGFVLRRAQEGKLYGLVTTYKVRWRGWQE